MFATRGNRMNLLRYTLVAALLLSGCASAPYWTRVYEPVLLTDIRIVDKPCGRTDWAGCNSRATGVIQIKRGLSQVEAWCVLEHEKRHLAGWNHYGTHGLLAYDCGNGETL